jgi:hypothetical protein
VRADAPRDARPGTSNIQEENDLRASLGILARCAARARGGASRGARHDPRTRGDGAPAEQWKLLMRVLKDLWKDVSPPRRSKSFKNAWKAK